MKKNYLSLTVLGLSLVAKSTAAPFLAVGDGAELFVTGNLGVRSDDNIFLAANADADVIFEVAPGLDLTFGKNGQLQGSLTVVDSITNYSDNSSLNTNLLGVNFNASYADGSKLKTKTALGYNETNQNTSDIRGLTRRDTFTASVSGEAEFSPLTAFSLGATFEKSDYKRASYSDSDTLTVPFNFYYKATPKSDISLGYRFRDNQTVIGSDSKDHFYSIGGRGDFTPKLKGSFAVGMNNRKLNTGGDESDLGIEAALTYELTPKAMLNIGLTRDFATSPQGLQQQNTSLNVQLAYKLDSYWSVNGAAVYRETEYTTRSDDYVEGSVGATYAFNSTVRIEGKYTHREYYSVISTSEFTNNVFSISAALRY
jgi:polysaccharide biosynthesis protein VpsM